MSNKEAYYKYVESKITLAKRSGFDISCDDLHSILFPHQTDVAEWALRRGKALIALSFGLGKTLLQTEIATQVIKRTGGKFLVICPLGVKSQFQLEDGPLMGVEWRYVTSDAEIQASDTPYLITNYERVRDGGIDPRIHNISGVSLDEGSVLRSMDSKTTNTFIEVFEDTPYKFVCTATPSPNNYKELIYYANFLGVADTGLSLTKWFKRDSQKAGNLTLHPHHEKNFWLWVASWGVFLYRPSDLGYSDEGYDLPKLNVHWHKVSVDHTRAWGQVDNRGQAKLFLDAATGTSAAAAEKRETLHDRLDKAVEILAEHPDRHWLVWHDLEREREAIEKAVPGVVTVYGAQSIEEKEKHIIDFSHGRIKILASKPSITGSGCNFQRHCHSMIFLGVSYFFQDFIQAIHRVWRFMQVNEVDVHIIYAESEEEIVRTLQRKWKQHDKLTEKMQDIVKKYGLHNTALKEDIKRQIGLERHEEGGEFFTAVNHDCVLEMFEVESDSVGLFMSSIPFSTQYEYSLQFEDFGHNPDNDGFWQQMDFLIPEMYRTLKPGRVAAIHVKDRVLYGHQTKSGFMEIAPFSDECVMAFRKHGFMYEGRRTLMTDVVKENNQTYRLGWTEMSHDASKMGSGMPEYLLLFRKPPSDKINARADEPVTKLKDKYTRGRWQIDAHSFWKSSGNRLLTPEEYAALNPKDAMSMWRMEQYHTVYDHERHVAICEALDKTGRLSASYMMLPPRVTRSEDDMIWDDIVYMRTLNSEQSRGREEAHLCLARNSLVLTKERGYIPIQAVSIGENVFTHMGRWRPVLAVQNTGVRETITIKGHGIPGLTLTPDHKLWSRKSTRIREREGAEYVEPTWIEAQDTERAYVNLKLPDTEVSSNLSPLHWWIVGRWIADGHWDARGSMIISCGDHKYDYLMSKLGEHAGAVSDTGTALQVRILNGDSSIKEIVSKCGSGAENKKLPPEAYTLPDELADALLSGYLSGDGHLVEKRQRWMASSVSKNLLLGLAILIQRVRGSIASVYAGRPAREAIIEGRIVNCKQDWILSFDLSPEERRQKPFILKDGAWKKIQSIEDAGVVETWNLRVAEDESFTAEGCIVKNCPLPLDIVERAIRLYSNEGDLVVDPFAGLFTTVYLAVKMGRTGMGYEINDTYFYFGTKYCKNAEQERMTPTLFDFLEQIQASNEALEVDTTP